MLTTMTTRKTIEDLEKAVQMAQKALEEAKATMSPVAEVLRKATLSHPMRPMSIEEIAAATGLTPSRVRTALEKTPVHNMGTDAMPKYIYVVGEIPTDQLLLLIAYMVAWKPMSHAELVQATNINRNRISNAITQVRDRLVNYGTPRRALWFLPGGIKKT